MKHDKVKLKRGNIKFNKVELGLYIIINVCQSNSLQNLWLFGNSRKIGIDSTPISQETSKRQTKGKYTEFSK